MSRWTIRFYNYSNNYDHSLCMTGRKAEAKEVARKTLVEYQDSLSSYTIRNDNIGVTSCTSNI